MELSSRYEEKSIALSASAAEVVDLKAERATLQADLMEKCGVLETQTESLAKFEQEGAELKGE